jgi:Asp-tRNA(Asn)/Glu-tRNA(Gln) amidotransferase B subunit
MRSKEEAHDYRYFPCPDLLPIELTQSYVDDIKATMPELPDAKKHRFMSDNGLSAYDADVLVAEREVADYFEIVAKGRDAKVAANWVISNLFGALKGSEKEILESPVSAENLGKLLDLLADDTISGRIAKDVFEIMFATGQDPARVLSKPPLIKQFLRIQNKQTKCVQATAKPLAGLLAKSCKKPKAKQTLKWSINCCVINLVDKASCDPSRCEPDE